METNYYKKVRKFLEDKGYYCGGKMVYANTGDVRYFENTGDRHLRADVVGIKNVGNNYVDQLEIAAVEVKEEGKIKQRDINQAYGYSSFAHKCYLATTADIGDEELTKLNRLGIGLIRIKKRGRPQESLTPKLMTPDNATMLNFLNSLWINQCTICKCYHFNWKKTNAAGKTIEKSNYNAVRDAQFKVSIDNLDPFDSLKKKELDKIHKIYRHVCKTCLEEFFIAPRIKERYYVNQEE